MINLRINRNILECKESKTLWRKQHLKVLIETYWNVKLIHNAYC